MKKMASAVWKGGLKDGKGTLSTESGVLSNAPYGFKARFEDGPGTNPEELLGAAHAGCFSMALSAQLGEARMIAESISTIATVTLDKVEGGFSITAVHLDLTAKADANMRSLSGGMKRRVLVAQALVHKPPVIVLDEPTAGVDVELRQGLWQFVRRMNRDGHSIVLTTHYLEEALVGLRQAGVAIREMEVHPPDLEEVFLRLTGRAS